ncbi:cytochrome b/b6 domain-containing protein [Kaistella palustris]|uniref:cytochrome b/b6 domain-containing protein n=1 Tax=Kaistella palustris TaxID=493376 RepID=UPI00041A0049|nr:cytochrome b/b6 domain-containing protein [Kaistella palustris]
MKKFTALHRLLHWISAFAILVLFTTGFLRIFWMSKASITAAVTKDPQIQNLNLNRDSLRTIAHSLQDPMFQWHIYAAYLITFAFVVRIIYMLMKGIEFPNPFSKNVTMNDRFQGMTYVLFYAFVALQIVTGGILKFDIGPDSLSGIAETTHKLAVYWAPLFILVHFAGIAISESINRKGISSKMIGGDSE